MKVISYVENRVVLLCQLTKQVPATGATVRIKGRNAIVEQVLELDEKTVQVQVIREAIVKSKVALDNSKKKKR
ncbi:hypothetical protein [Mangrovibacillus cuniculi]|uniref:Uncharacterized protein n=1 Tax=Mangrovibacillus cuniculi TaxID=2593652 RepID=A0A7S8CCA3_9BACI|nr:hypothetical protein [Mangrovibacillus cuniculi]QPC47173.1 hypothetical protein G8O30_09425 [Mangrovibacillus cuniculi]